MKIFNRFPTPLTFKRKKENITFLLKLIRSSLGQNIAPKLNKEILKDQSFFSLIKATYNISIAHQALKKYPEYQNSWLYNEVKKYLKFYKEKERANQEIIKLLKRGSKEVGIRPIILKEYNYKLLLNNKTFFRFSNDVDILIKRSELLKYDSFLENNNFLLNGADLEIDFQPPLSTDGNFISNKKNKQNKKIIKQQLIEKLKGYNKDIKYIKNPNTNPQFLEVHFYPNNYGYFKNFTPLELIYKNTYQKNSLKMIKPEARILYDANHFFLHLRFKRTLENGLSRFMCNLQRIYDIGFNLKTKEKINWQRLVFLAHKYNTSPHAYGYLMLGKKYLNFDIPQKIINKLKKQSDPLQVSMINNIDALSIFQDKKDKNTKNYIKNYLKLN